MFSTSFLTLRTQCQTISGQVYWNPSSMMAGVFMPLVLNPAARKTVINILTTSQNTSSWNPVKTELLCAASRSSFTAKYCEVSPPQIIPVEMTKRWIYQTLRRGSITNSHLILNFLKQNGRWKTGTSFSFVLAPRLSSFPQGIQGLSGKGE